MWHVFSQPTEEKTQVASLTLHKSDETRVDILSRLALAMN